MDGTARFARFADFGDLRQSPFGCGAIPFEALDALTKAEEERRTADSSKCDESFKACLLREL